ncbi:MAG: DUF2007 domain-containing protein [Gammaproteobacteria bacterium]|nr:DUF2007 domain-containing protein [Pseudomonadales bacterium]MCP5349007.1 DUF2007 domain-containing protein [Pseudomonadales bacterium]
MKRVYTADNRALAWHIKNILESNTVAAEIRNDTLHSAQGGVPVNECYPEVWVVNDSDEETARRLIEEQVESVVAEEAQWLCENCGETNYGQFELCWNCQAERSSQS